MFMKKSGDDIEQKDEILFNKFSESQVACGVGSIAKDKTKVTVKPVFAQFQVTPPSVLLNTPISVPASRIAGVNGLITNTLT